jgi:ACS family hexuronate transporter-like MFS transporter
MPRSLRHLRWYIGGLLFLSTVINYIDRQTLSVLGPYIKTEYGWNNSSFALILIAFRFGYLGQFASGRFLDWIGTRRGLSITVAFYSCVAALSALATGLRSFFGARFLLGLGESANWPGATKAVSEWFPRRESGLAVALFDSGSAVGAAVAPALVLWAHQFFGSWRPAFIVTGALGFLWLILFRMLYRRPEEHPLISDAERAMILAERSTPEVDEMHGRLSYRMLLGLPQTWGIIIGKTLSDPVWYFIADWFPIYLVSKGYRLEGSLLAFWVVFLSADVGNFVGGGASSYLISRGWSVGRARKAVIIVTGIGMALLMPTVFLHKFAALVACFAIATLCYAAFSTMVLNLPADVYPTHSVASVSGMSGTSAGVATIAATYLIGRVSDAHSFEPVLVVASMIPLVATVAVVALVRNNHATEQHLVNRI